ncbi:LpxL/LpxP family acyltransferase [Candidatus Lokiarchaeum ossiferum]|uniref:LpxL/LpxP family acyltransferase n=1 Tax=Candidatus Lokiarchaeum ossiferum TaxID=2951803 RepID=UPI00352FC621
MAHIFYADKRNLRSDQQKGVNKGNFRKKEENQSWGSSMKGIFRFIAWIGRYRIYRPNKFLPLSSLNAWGHLIGKFLFGSSRSVQKKARASLKALYPSISDKKLTKWVDAFAKYMGMLFIDIGFRLPLTSDLPISTYYDYENIEKLDEALALGKGVIIPTLHIGQHLHVPSMLFQHPKHYTVTSVISIANMTMYENGNRKEFDNLYCYASTKFSKISPYLKRHLESNHILLMYHDYSTKGQLKVPFIQGKFPFLINAPQSYIKLHRLTGAIILPAIAVPDQTFGKSRLIFLDNSSIMKISEEYQNSTTQEFHGRMSTEINRVLYPFARKYAHVWEELMRLPTRRCKDELCFESNSTIANIIGKSKQKMISILEDSFEPERNDKEIKKVIQKFFNKIESDLNDPQKNFRNHKTKIDLSIRDSLSEMCKICQVLNNELSKLTELKAATSFSELEIKLSKIFFLKDPEEIPLQFIDDFEEAYNLCVSQQNFISEWKSKIWRVMKRYILENKVTLQMEAYRTNIINNIKILHNCISKNTMISEDELYLSLKDQTKTGNAVQV